MDENEFRTALRTTMTVAPPPPMTSEAAVTAGRRAVRVRRSALSAGATAAVVLVAALGVSLATRPQAGAPAAGPAPSAGTPSEPSAADSKPVWPTDGNGEPQEDATSRAGLRYNQGKKLLTELLEVVPAGWTAPEFTSADGIESRSHQAQVEGDNTGDTWSYLASAAVSRNNRTGQLLAEIHTPGNGLPQDLCELGRSFWTMGGTCELSTTGGKQVAVLDATGTEPQQDQWAAYRHPDGTVVFISQTRNPTTGQTDRKRLVDLPLTPAQLAALAVQDRFHLS